MKKLTLFFLAISTLLIASCSSNEDEYTGKTDFTINFTHNWNGTSVTSDDFNVIQFVNLNGDRLSIERLRYLISDIYVENSSGTITDIKDYILVDLDDEDSMTFTTENVLLDGTYDIYMRFGFSDEDNTEGAYADLTSENFNVGTVLGGGYHYMQMDGKFENIEPDTSYNFHVISAYNSDTAEREDTSYLVDLGEIEIEDNTVTVNVEMDINQWFEDDNQWDIKVDYVNLMSNYEAQIMMSENVDTVFSLAEEEEEDEE